MNMRGKHPALIGCVMLAILATGISLSLSIFTGWRLGDSVSAKLMMAAFGVLAVMGAHLMPAICGSTSRSFRIVAMTLWIFCLAYAAFSHANFFLSTQEQTGVQREMAIVSASVIGTHQKDLVEVLNDKIKIRTDLAKMQSHCHDACLRLASVKANLEARLAVLDAEEATARNWQNQLVQQQRRQQMAHDDPVLGRLAEWLNVTTVRLELLMGLLFSVILEGVACLCWYLVLRSRDLPMTHLAPTAVIAPVEANAGMTNISQIGQMPSSQQYDDRIEELARLVKGEHLKLTVASIREYCRCAQGKAADLKRLVQARLEAEHRV